MAASLRRPSGFTLIESMAAMSVLLVGSLGLIGLHSMGVAMNGDARVMSRATAIAEDLVAQIQTWNLTQGAFASDTRLTAGSGADIGDAAGAFQTSSFTADHSEAELGTPTSAPPFLGLPTTTVQSLGGVSFTRYWNIADDTDTYGNVVDKKIAVIVRWVQPNGGARRIVLFTVLKNPAST